MGPATIENSLERANGETDARIWLTHVSCFGHTELRNRMSKTIWRLQSSTHKLVECCVEETASKLHAVTIVLGSETFLNECHPDAASALRRAMHVRDGLLMSGDWSVPIDVARVDEPTSCLPRDL